RPTFPSSLLLQAFRLLEGNPQLDYSAFLSALPESFGFLPGELNKLVDDVDWWLSKIAPKARFLDGVEAVRKNFPELDKGIVAQEMRESVDVGIYEGILDFGAARAHPIVRPKMSMSSSRLECLASCPFKYFLNFVLGIKKPDELEYDPGRWLDAWRRGELIHEIFCEFMKELVKKEERVEPQKHRAIIQKKGEEIISRYKEKIPPPSEGIFEKEKDEVMETLDVFLAAESKQAENVVPLLFEVIF
ncbi:unnamed protein product, partial [marine sediment metagenome]